MATHLFDGGDWLVPMYCLCASALSYPVLSSHVHRSPQSTPTLNLWETYINVVDTSFCLLFSFVDEAGVWRLLRLLVC